MVTSESEPDEQIQKEISDQGGSQSAEFSRQTILKRLIGGTGSVLGFARLKLVSWYEAEAEQSNVPHIDL